jgi:hypothetical protein
VNKDGVYVENGSPVKLPRPESARSTGVEPNARKTMSDRLLSNLEDQLQQAQATPDEVTPCPWWSVLKFPSLAENRKSVDSPETSGRARRRQAQ